ncbi:hypothetical protein CBR_g24214 [Chara braunii]|uniref:Uncharacterized protein n=1 Tax=Chara braunii TaxID=69332 RepID=A0A388L643_CHABU|nr:hypothetical protein CBR_g24214 [Chara braunii]|eukprot:GBG77767.1 hypothetical protein CBR_g24214 [Chara braunii]
MSFLTERALRDHMLAPGGDISAMRQVHHPRFSLDLLRFTQFFSTTGVYAIAEFRFAANRQALVLAEASAYRLLSAPGVSHMSTVVVFSGDISSIDPLWHTTVRAELRKRGQQLAVEVNQWLAWHGDNLVVTDNIDVGGLRTSRHEPPLTWMRDIEHHAWIEYAELLIVQAWRTEVEGDLLGFLFGSVRPDHRQLIMRELTVPLAQLVDDLSLDIISQCDESPVPYVLSQTLSPYLHWSACLEGQEGDNNQPSQVKYLNPRRIIDISFFQPHTTSKDEVLALEEEEEEDDEEKEQEEDDEEEEEETPEEGSYSEHSEEEQSEKEEEEDQEQEESERENSGEEANCTEVQKEDPKATARRREEIAAGKQPLEYASGTDLPISDGPTKDPEPPKPEDGDLATKTSSALARWRRNRSPSPSTSTRPVVRTCTDAGHRASSPVLIPPSP